MTLNNKEFLRHLEDYRKFIAVNPYANSRGVAKELGVEHGEVSQLRAVSHAPSRWIEGIRSGQLAKTRVIDTARFLLKLANKRGVEPSKLMDSSEGERLLRSERRHLRSFVASELSNGTPPLPLPPTTKDQFSLSEVEQMISQAVEKALGSIDKGTKDESLDHDNSTALDHLFAKAPVVGTTKVSQLTGYSVGWLRLWATTQQLPRHGTAFLWKRANVEEVILQGNGLPQPKKPPSTREAPEDWPEKERIDWSKVDSGRVYRIPPGEYNVIISRAWADRINGKPGLKLRLQLEDSRELEDRIVVDAQPARERLNELSDAVNVALPGDNSFEEVSAFCEDLMGHSCVVAVVSKQGGKYRRAFSVIANYREAG